MRSSIVVAVALLALAAAASARTLYGPVVDLEADLPAWKRCAMAPNPLTTRVQTSAVVKLPAAVEGALYAKVQAASDPESPSFGQHWTRDELVSKIRPSDVAVAKVVAWAQSIDPTATVEVSPTGNLVHIDAPLSALAAAIDADIECFVHERRPSVSILRTLGAYALPSRVGRHVDLLSAIKSFPVLREGPDHVSDVGASGHYVDPAILDALYNISSTPVSSSTDAKMGCAEFEHQYFSPFDLEVFEKKYSLEKNAVTQTFGFNDHIGHTEANLDIQYISATGEGVPSYMYIDGGFGFDMIKWVDAVLANNDSASVTVWSVSYGEELSAVSASYAQSLNAQFTKMASIGVSMIFASGDSGVYSRQGGTSTFHPSYPACLPGVTAVGALTLNEDGTAETGAVDWSGGGFSLSDYFERTSDAPWQVKAVNAYIANQTAAGTLPPANMWDASGVGFPDVSTAGVDFKVIMLGIAEDVSGTSCAAPTFSGIVARINAARLAAGKSTLGFLNPFLYGAADYDSDECPFTDIVSGVNNNGNKYGFSAAPGWDPTSGLGSPRAGRLLAAAMKLP